MSGSLRDRLPDWMVLAQESWGPVERRNQRLVRALAGRNPAARFLFVERALRPRELRRWRWPRPRQVAPGIWTLQVIRPLPDRLAKRLSDSLEAAQVRAGARRLGLERPWLWTQDPRVSALVDRLRPGGLLYDLTDDWAAFEEDPERRTAVQAQITELGSRADIALACSRPLQESAQGFAHPPLYLPNAVDPPQFDGPRPAALARVPRPRVGYVGTRHGARLDIDLLVAVAGAHPALSFVFLGPDHLDAPDHERLFGLPNVHDLGVCEHAEVGSYLAGFDAALLPNRLTGFTRSLDPLKTYEYLAAGLAVIATDAGIPRELEAFVARVDGPEAFGAAIEAALLEDSDAARQARQVAVAGETWDARAAAIERAVGVGAAGDDVGGDTDRQRVDVSIVIVSFNTRELLARCLATVREQADVTLQTIVVDNDSADGSAAMVARDFPEVELIQSGANLGFAAGNNLAFPRCRGDHVLLLNSDAFLAPYAVAELVTAAQRHPRAGAVGARLLNEDGSLQRSAWPFPAPARLLLESVGLHRLLRASGMYEDLGTWAHDRERSVDFLIGACLLLRAEALAEVGGFDEDFWLYAEEADLQWRLAMRGWDVVFAPGAVATHVGGASQMDTVARMRHFYAGQFRFLAKHHGRVAALAGRLALLIGSTLRRRWPGVAVAVLPKPTGGSR